MCASRASGEYMGMSWKSGYPFRLRFEKKGLKSADPLSARARRTGRVVDRKYRAASGNGNEDNALSLVDMIIMMTVGDVEDALAYEHNRSFILIR